MSKSISASAGPQGGQDLCSVGFVIRDLKQHPLSAAFPAMSVEELTGLQLDIEEHGLTKPVVLFDGMVIDGWHRWTCCQRLRIVAKVVDLPAGVDPRRYVKSQNLHRRHLNASQRALAVVACNEWMPNGANQHSKAGGEPGSPPASANVSMAKEADVSTRTIKQAKLVSTRASREVRDAVKAGEMSLKAAVATTKPTLATPIPVPTPGPITVITLEPAAAALLDPTPTPDLEPASAAELTLQQKYDDLMERSQELARMLEETQVDNARMSAVIDADDHLKAAMARIKQLEALVDVMEVRAGGLMAEKNEAIQAAKRWQRKAEAKK
jgi:hypothetical protein